MCKLYFTRGSALLSALFIMTMVAIAATAMGTRLQLDIYRTRLSILSDKLYLASEAVTFWSMNQLKRKQAFTANKYGQILRLPGNLANIYPEVTLSGAVYDMQALFNLNNLTEKNYKPVFLRLLQLKLPKLSPQQGNVIYEATKSWISDYQPGKGQEKWMNIYARAKPPYLSGCQLMVSVSEFRLISGITVENYQLLSPFITVLPEVTPLNINTMPPSLLGILGKGLKESEIADLVQARGARGFKNIAEATRALGKLQIPTEQITVESKYFLTTAKVTLEDLNLNVFVLLKRMPNQTATDPDMPFQVSIISESYNTL